MALDSRFVLAYSFSDYFVDKNTGLPLAAGYVNFYQDNARTVPMQVYTITGSPPNYSYIAIGSTVYTNGAGQPIYDNNIVPIYFFPYDGTPTTSTGILTLYFYEVYNSNNIFQYSCEGQPNVTASSTTQTVEDNYIPNGQFLIHNNVPAISANNYTVGQITQPVTIVAPGGWTYERPVGSTAKDIVTFTRIGSVSSTNPPDNPRYQFTLNVQSFGTGDAIKDLRVRFGSVNKFNDPTQEYTFVFSGVSNTGNDLANVQIILHQEYGSGGSPYSEVVLGTVTLSPTQSVFTVSFNFGTSTGKNMGIGDDDYFQLCLRFPGNSVLSASVTDFGLFEGIYNSPTFMPTSNRQMEYQSLFQDYNFTSANNPLPTPSLVLNGLPAADGSSSYLPMVLTSAGVGFDNSIIGKVEQHSSITLSTDFNGSIHNYSNLLLADGNQYETAGYSPLGIPYARLQAKYWNTTSNIPQYGTGDHYVTGSIYSSTTNEIIMCCNSAGIVTDAADHGTTFTIKTIHTGATTYHAMAYIYANTDEFHIQCTSSGPVSTINAGTSGFSVTTIQTGGNNLVNIDQVTTTAASSLPNPGSAGKYFQFSTYNSGNQDYFVWYFFTNETDPAPGGTGIKVELNSADSAAVVAEKTREAINAWQVTTIDTVAGSSVPASSYFTFSSTTTDFYCWYTVSGTGTDPQISGAVAIPVVINSTDTAAQVATATQIAINSKYYATPNYQGVWLRGYDPNQINDSGNRHSVVPGVIGHVMGSFELDSIQSHAHTLTAGFNDTGTSVPDTGGNSGQVTTATEYTGAQETRVRNYNVITAIRY